MNNPIKSDDENAIAKLEQKLKILQETQDLMKQVNKLCRLNPPDLVEQLKALNLTDQQIHELLNPRYSFEVKGFQAWELRNNNASIKQTKTRLEALKRESELKEENRLSAKGKGWELFEATEDHRLCYRFDGKPDDSTRSLLKSHGFKWSPSRGLWIRLLNQQARSSATHWINPKLPQ